MRLEKIVLHGFKSFADKTELQVLPGINAIVGPNGCGKCLVGGTPVILRDGRLVPIRDLVETALSQAHTARELDDGIVAFGPTPEIEVLSLNPVTLKLEARPVEAFIRRRAPAFLLRVRTRSGREVVTTHYHPFFTLEQGALRVLTAETLVEGIRIAVPRWLPIKPGQGETLEQAALSRFGLEDRVYLPPSAALRAWLDAARRRVGGWQPLADATGIAIRHLMNARGGQGVKVGAVARIAATVLPLTFPVDALKSAGRTTIRLPKEVDGRLARFLGYLIAEGRVTRVNQVWRVNGEPAVTAEFSRLADEVFGVAPRQLKYKSTATDTLIFSRALCLLLDRVFGMKVEGRSPEKTVPSQILTAPDEVVREFLSGLFEGDGHVHLPTQTGRNREVHVEYITASRQLAEQVCTLLLRLGVFPLIRRRIRYAANREARRRRAYWGVYVYGIQQLRLLASQLKFVGRKQSGLDALLKLDAIPNPNLDLVPGLRSLVRAAIGIGGLPIKPFRPLSPRLAAYAEGRCEASRAGVSEIAGLIQRHGRTHEDAREAIRQLRALADSDVYWDEVVNIERVAPPDPWVYDLTVADTHNFIAGNVIVHNSNISESIRWALGEQSPKALRGHRMEDVIFHGSASRKPLGMAEVSLVFANDGTLSVPWGEVQVSRRLYRDGESEYLLNKGVCRLRDILDLFVGTGANPKAYALVDQERLNHVLTARPLDRRALIEEAAGTSRYKQQRAETVGKLDAARQNLLRVRDVMDEVKRQLGSLERQARKAKQYKALQAEKQSLGLALLAAEHASLLAQERELDERMRRFRDDEDALRVKLSQLAAREATQRAQIQDADHRLGDLRQAVQKVQVEVERLLERGEQLELQLRELGEEDVRLQEETRLIAERRAGLATERETKARALSVSAGAHREHGEVVGALTRELDGAKAELQSARERLEALRLTQVRVAWERSEMTRTLGELREREHQLRRRHERLVREIEQGREEARDLSMRRASIEAERAEARVARALLEEDRRRLAARAADAEAQRVEAQTALERLRLGLAACQSSLQALEQLEREREGYGEGVRAVFSGAAAASVRGVLGTVADLLNVPRGFETAVEAVLGERLTWVVVERFEDAKTALAFLKRENAGPATFLPLETLPPSNGLPTDENGARWAGRLVESSHADLLHYLLGRVAIVSHLGEAEALWRRNGQVVTYVTLSGEVLSPTGRLSGGRTSSDAEPPATSLLGRKRAIRDAALERERFGREIAYAQSRLDGVETELGALRDQEGALLRSIQSEEVRAATGEQDLAQVVREAERVSQHLETLAAEERELLAEVQDARQLRERLEHDAAAQRGSEESLERSSAELRGVIERLEADEGRLAQAATAARVNWASLGERLEALRRELEQLDGMDGDLSARLAQAEERRRQMANRKAEVEQERERAGQLVREMTGERDRLEADERAAAARHQSLLDEFREVEALLRASEQALGRLRDELHAAELRATEGRVRREELEQTARRSFGAEPEVLPRHHDAERNLEEARRRLGELEEKLLAMGAVNLAADEEYRELEDRLEFLRTQHEDLVASIKDLEKALRAMTSIASERFQEAFEAINRHFGEIFARLFEGGRAELRLVPPEEGEEGSLDTGVDLMAQPRGKRLQSVTLLSGGEKALTGLALLFAIFYHRPSPFCVLDEVDAPLDDANIHRFLRVLRELSSQTQFLVITHNRKTMEAADVLYGITTEEPGLSRLVSVKLAEDHP